MKSLKVLNLSNNGLFSVEAASFASLPNLQEVDLGNNRLSMEDDFELSYSFLRYCKKLEKILLRNNSVTTIFDDWLMTHLHLENLDLSYNKIEKLDVSSQILFSRRS